MQLPQVAYPTIVFNAHHSEQSAQIKQWQQLLFKPGSEGSHGRWSAAARPDPAVAQ
jgi:hypothetical protein